MKSVKIKQLTKNLTKVNIRPGDLDAYGHVNHAVYLQYFEFGRYQWIKENNIILDEDIVLPVVSNINLDYVKQIYLDSEVYVESEFYKVNHFSMIMKQSLIDKEKLLFSKALVTIAFIDRKKEATMRMTKIFKDYDEYN